MSRRVAITKVDPQGPDEQIVYTGKLPTGTSPTSLTATVWDITLADHVDVTSTVMPTGSASATGDTVTYPTLKLLTLGHTYRVEVRFTSGGQVISNYFDVPTER